MVGGRIPSPRALPLPLSLPLLLLRRCRCRCPCHCFTSVASEIGPDFSPGIRTLSQNRASAPGICSPIAGRYLPSRRRYRSARASSRGRSEGAAGTNRSITFLFIHLPNITPKKPNKKLSSPPASGKQDNSIKTKEKIVENNWHSSFTQFGKIELTKKSRSRPGYPAGPSHLTQRLGRSKPNPNLLNNLSKTPREGANQQNQQPATNNQQPRFKCRHIFTDGRRCASPSLRQENFCYFHHTTRRPITPEIQKERRRTTARLNEFHLPLPEDRSAIQSSIGIILQNIANNDLDPRRAGLLLYALQIASLNLPKQQPQDEEDAEELVQEFTTDPEYGTLAPQTEIQEKKSSIALLLEELTQPKPAVLPQIQATAQTHTSPKLKAQSSQLRSKPHSPRTQQSTTMDAEKPMLSPRHSPFGLMSRRSFLTASAVNSPQPNSTPRQLHPFQRRSSTSAPEPTAPRQASTPPPGTPPTEPSPIFASAMQADNAAFLATSKLSAATYSPATNSPPKWEPSAGTR